MDVLHPYRPFWTRRTDRISAIHPALSAAVVSNAFTGIFVGDGIAHAVLVTEASIRRGYILSYLPITKVGRRFDASLVSLCFSLVGFFVEYHAQLVVVKGKYAGGR